MRKFISWSLAISLLMIFPNTKSEASLGGVEDFSNPRIVPIYDSSRSDSAAFSGFLYSPRIIFTVAHSDYSFDKDGTKVNQNAPQSYVGSPNSITDGNTSATRVKVIKKIFSKTYRFDNALLGDFAIYILEKDLASVKPVKLLTPEIEAELIADQVDINLHGYGAFSDFCASGQAPPCAVNPAERSKAPRLITAKLYALSEVEKIVGYQRPQLKGSLTYFRPGKSSICSGDSGGSATVIYKNDLMYLTVIGTGMNTYGCGTSSYFDGFGGIHYSTPIYKHLDIINEAELFVAGQVALEEAAIRLAKAEEEAKAKAEEEARAKAEEEAKGKAEEEAKAKAEEEAKAKAEEEAKAKLEASKKKTTITCVKGKLTKKVKAVKPRCPTGYKKK